MKLRLTAALLAALTTGAVTAQDTTSEKGRLSYAIGYEIGRDLNERKLDVDMNTVIRAIQDGHAKRNPAVPEPQMAEALRAMQEKLVAEARAEFERVSSQNKAASDKFLAENRTKQGVTVLPSGIQYRVIENGNGRQPSATSEVQIHFRGSLHTGQEFASTYSGNQPVTIKVNEAPLPGLQEVLPMMRQGSRWEIYLPAEHAYGNSPRSPIGPNQAVVFDVRLIEVK
ncbi:FKBP-type peptidyl-prolyl cis-trans isomerase [Rehaibacterium terrae]|jgi:FKBP-type peptidyl-prolyl cis-trans isomerase|uniref:Peptidyl-prolyl cis-trans isomerase n=1 Tax=Rehaibacterium terrae TaxID=1341696 RepID=A0A7W8DEA1_9GAMM|nr:FKBP-type peptidyl-prolyl cis-trans isomerase [Rehaibacterium terrae]MBB5015616.1 FKBP-type peptidyl-prolyl cis-trans isomerase [Rehaibacterium terrae]